MGSIKFTGNLLMAGLFAFAIISFAIYFADGNDVAVDLANDPDLVSVRTNLETNASQLTKEDYETTSTSFFESQAEGGDQVSTSGSQFKVGIGTATTMATTSAKAGYDKLFGSNNDFSIFFTAISGFLLFVGIMYGYKAWFGRNPD